MTDAELFAFMDVFRSVTRVFPLRGEEHEIRDVGASYFKAMRRFSVADVHAGAEVWIQRGERFPKPAQWIEAIPRKKTVVEVPTMTDSEARDYRRAEELRYEDAPCHCKACVEAGVSEKPLRFVPEFTLEDTDRKVRDPIGDRIVTAGHWAHGLELAGYYRARGDFWEGYYRLLATRAIDKQTTKASFRQRMQEIFTPKHQPAEPEPSA